MYHHFKIQYWNKKVDVSCITKSSDSSVQLWHVSNRCTFSWQQRPSVDSTPPVLKSVFKGFLFDDDDEDMTIILEPFFRPSDASFRSSPSGPAKVCPKKLAPHMVFCNHLNASFKSVQGTLFHTCNLNVVLSESNLNVTGCSSSGRIHVVTPVDVLWKYGLWIWDLISPILRKRCFRTFRWKRWIRVCGLMVSFF